MQPEDDEVIDLCSMDEEKDPDCVIFPPVKPKLTEASPESNSSEFDPDEVIRHVIPNVCDDFHDPSTKAVPILARPQQGLTVDQLFALMVGAVPADRICSRKPTSVRFSAVFVVDLSRVSSLDDLRADDNGV